VAKTEDSAEEQYTMEEENEVQQDGSEQKALATFENNDDPPQAIHEEAEPAQAPKPVIPQMDLEKLNVTNNIPHFDGDTTNLMTNSIDEYQSNYMVS